MHQAVGSNEAWVKAMAGAGHCFSVNLLGGFHGLFSCRLTDTDGNATPYSTGPLTTILPKVAGRTRSSIERCSVGAFDRSIRRCVRYRYGGIAGDEQCEADDSHLLSLSYIQIGMFDAMITWSLRTQITAPL